MLVATMLDIQVIADLYFQMKKKRLSVEIYRIESLPYLMCQKNTVVYEKQTSKLNILSRRPHLSAMTLGDKFGLDPIELR